MTLEHKQNLFSIFLNTFCWFLSQGSFDSLKATFTLKRRTTYFIFQHFIPSAFLVFLSWLSFWVDRHAVPARISLVITCILSTMFLFESINSSLPRISYLKAVDYYLITSFVFIVSCMVEYVCVLNFPDKASALLRSQSLAPVSPFSFLTLQCQFYNIQASNEVQILWFNPLTKIFSSVSLKK